MRRLNFFDKTLLTCSACLFNIAIAANDNLIIENSVISGSNIIIDGNNMGGTALKGSGAYQSKNQTLPYYDAVIINGSFDVNYYRKKKSSAKISAYSNLLPFVKVSIKNNTLYLKMDKSYSTQKPIVVDIFSPILTSITVHGASNVRLNSIRADNFKIHLVGSGDIIANGKTNTLNVSVSGSGDVEIKKLISKNATVDLTGSADIEVTAQENLKVSISGSGDVTYYGNPQKINKNISGSGDITSGD
jgi:hypothetical protein